MVNFIRKQRAVILAVAWGCFLVSLAAPAAPDPFLFLPWGRTPIAVLLALAAFSLVGEAGRGPYLLLLPPAICFLVTPALLFIKPRRPLLKAISQLATFGLLSACALQFHWQFMDAGLRFEYGFQYLMWGYYLFVVAHALAFIACMVGPPEALQRSGPGGCAVLPPAPSPPQSTIAP